MKALALAHRAIADVFAPEPFWVLWPVKDAIISQVFGNNPDYYGKWFKDKYGNKLGHEGVDFWKSDILGMPILAGFGGTVYRVETTDNSEYGLQVRIGNGIYKMAYAHMLRTSAKVGDFVRRGDVLGYAGNTGNSTGPHLHITLKKDGATASGESKYTGTATDIINPTPLLRKV